MKTSLYFLHALSPVHVGIGQAVGVVDLPIMRAKSTNFPLIPGSAMKGVLRDFFSKHEDQVALFGPANVTDSEAMAGALILGDAHLLALPVRSFAGVFAYVTCPYVLSCLVNDLKRSGVEKIPFIPAVAGEKAIVSDCSVVTKGDKVYLEDLDLTAERNAQAWAEFLANKLFKDIEQEIFKARFLIVADEIFAFLSETATEVRARIRIDDEHGVVNDTALWYEENLPTETILWGFLGMENGKTSKAARNSAVKSAEQLLQSFTEHVGKDTLLQVGGKATIGRGLVRFLMGV